MQHIQKFESSMFEYCQLHTERAIRLIEDGEVDTGLDFLEHTAGVLAALVEARNSQGTTNINEFVQSVKEFGENDKDDVYTHLQENGFGQYIPE
jgi:hypothetical protein